MNQRHQQFADDVLAAFRANLDEADQQRIGEARFRQLHGLIREALSRELAHVAGQMEALLQAVRAEIDKPPREL